MERPAAIPIRLTTRREAVVEALAAQRFVSPDLFQLQVLAERLSLIAGFDELVCLDDLPFRPFDYQVRTAQTALRRFRGRGLLCDEVGLGKTIEAGLVLKEYLVRGMVRRVLVLAPPGLVEQWRDELATKFDLSDFVTSADDEFRALESDAWERFPRVIASLATARQSRHRAAITDLVYDLVIVDEAHHLKNRASVTWKFVNALQKKYILFLTATPVQNKLDELYNLITILKPGQLQTPREFHHRFVAGGGDPRLPKNRGRLRELLADVMVRHSRGQVSVKLPPRRAHTVRLDLSPEEDALYQDVSNLVRSLIGTPGTDDGSVSHLTSAHRFTLRTLQREIGSSPAAARPTLLKLADNARLADHRPQLLALADRAARIDRWAKAKALTKLLPGLLVDPAERVIIFTHFRPTLDLLAERLAAMQIKSVVYHGGLPVADKTAAIERFEREAQVLLSTEAAGEGRNLQFCHTMINFDLPWNPMRIEQRVGRIHRIGQTRPVDIYTLSARGTIEDYLLDILERKINIFELVIGEMDMILGHVTEEADFEELVLEVWTRARTEAEIERGMADLGDALVQARVAYQQAQEYDDALFGEDLAAD
jgi:SNF2 family DNA or RNA helicase